jgi:hypothetical protein
MEKEQIFMSIDTLTVKQIAQQKVDDKNLRLPSVQRGFVWKPSQIENLWDSLLRGYPVGSFVVSKNEDGDIQILDGQQRATSIGLAFHDIFTQDSKVLRANIAKYKLFIDLSIPAPDENYSYYFRVITRAHPWGYDRNDNTKTLLSDHIAKALDMFREVKGVKEEAEWDYLDEESLDLFWPEAAGCPLPFHLFLQEAMKNSPSENSLRDEISKWCDDHKPVKALLAYAEKEKNKFYSLTNILTAAGEMVNTRKFPVMFVELQKFKRQSIVVDNDNDADGNDSKMADEIENVFTRLNAGGTPLTGEELNYSILKAHLDKDRIDKIETACAGLMAPSRFITIAFRLYQHCKGKGNSLQLRIKPKVFQNAMDENRGDFQDFIDELLEKENMLKKVKDILTYSGGSKDYRLPYSIVISIAARSPEIMFLLCYRLYKGDGNKMKADTHRKMLGCIMLMLWLGRGDERRNYRKLLPPIWPFAEIAASADEFWSKQLIKKLRINNNLSFFPKYSAIKNTINSVCKKNIRANEVTLRDKIDRDYYNKNNEYSRIPFISLFLDEKQLILYAQKDYLYKRFSDEQFELEDTNRPFDWDHISPNKWVRNQRRIYSFIKDIYSTNGNFWAVSYSENREMQEISPNEKLDRDNFYEHSCCNYKRSDWTDYTYDNIDDFRDKQKNIYKTIINRNLYLYKIFWDSLCINDLYADDDKGIYIDFRKIIGRNIRNEYQFRRIRECEDLDGVTPYISISDNCDSFIFGISEKLSENKLDSLYRKLKNKDNCELDSNQEEKLRTISQTFTLAAQTDTGYKKIQRDIVNWIDSFPQEYSRAIKESVRINLVDV